MNYRDPLFDKNAHRDDDTVDEMLANNASAPEGGDKAKARAEEMKGKGEDLTRQGKQKGQEAADQAHARADEGIDKASEGLGTAADRLRQQGASQGGTAGGYANTAADKLDQASGYLREKDSEDMLTDLEDLVRRKPMESLLAAAGIGLLLSRIIR